ncbi:MAG: toll/interleukin-1 receptor domain-containing protein [Ginsengibacter sp.]
MNYYFNADNIPNQDLVFETYNFFQKKEGKNFFEPLDFLNLLNWHYRFLMNNVALPFSVLDQFTHLPLSKEEQHILIGFILKWFGGYPVHNLNSQYNTTLKLLEEEYLEIIENNNNEIQEKINTQLSGKNLSKDEEKRLKLLKSYDKFLTTLDKVIANRDGAAKLKQLENEINQSLTPVNKNEKPVKKIFVFLSHSSKDEQLVKLFTDKILRLLLNLKLDHIFCTSIEACSITSGHDFKEFIKLSLLNATHVIQIITENYKKSEVCLNEMGAAWVLENRIFPFILEPVNYENVGFIHHPNQLLKLNQKKDLLKFIDEIKENVVIVAPQTEIDRHIDDFLLQLNNLNKFYTNSEIVERKVVLFESQKVKKYFFLEAKEFMYEEDKPKGEIAKGDFTFENQVIEIIRRNTHGIFLLRIVKYNSEGATANFIKSGVKTSGDRIINIKFQAKTTNGYHIIFFIAKEFKSKNWIGKAYSIFKISNSSWQDYENQIRIPANFDFVIDICDREVENSNSGIQIKELIIEEIEN